MLLTLPEGFICFWSSSLFIRELIPFRSIPGVRWTHKYVGSILVPTGLRYKYLLLWFWGNLALLESSKCSFYKCCTLSSICFNPGIFSSSTHLQVFLYVTTSKNAKPSSLLNLQLHPVLKPIVSKMPVTVRSWGTMRNGHKSLANSDICGQ